MQPYRLFVLLACALVVIVEGFDAQIISFSAPAIIKVFAIPKAALGPVFAAGIVGLLAGAFCLSPIADRIGRKPVIIGSLVFFGICSLLTVTATSANGLIFWRFVTGFGFGGAIPNAITLGVDYVPARTKISTGMFLAMGIALGGAIGGPIVGPLIERGDWYQPFYLGGFVPLVLAGVLAIWLPESARFLALRGEHGKVAKILKRVNPKLSYDASTSFSTAERLPEGAKVTALFREGRSYGTILLWISLVAAYYCLYLLSNWLPTLITSSGHTVSDAVNAAALLQFGGFVGGIALLKPVEWFGKWAVAVTYVVASFAIVTIGVYSTAEIQIIMTVTFASGFFLIAGVIAVVGLLGDFYPTAIRSTGVGWGIGIARIGAISGPMIGGWLAGLDWDAKSIFLVAAAPALVAALSIVLIARPPAEVEPINENSSEEKAVGISNI